MSELDIDTAWDNYIVQMRRDTFIYGYFAGAASATVVFVLVIMLT